MLMSLCGNAVALDYRAAMLCHVGWLHTSSKGANEVSESSVTMLTAWKALRTRAFISPCRMLRLDTRE